jgi:hypothetical protein
LFRKEEGLRSELALPSLDPSSMILSHEHRFIFLKTRKTASTSIEIALSSICGKDDIITPLTPEDEKVRKSLGYRGPQNLNGYFKHYSLKDWGKFFLKRNWQFVKNHATALEVKDHIPSEVWNNYFKFCFERNPFDKVISHMDYRFNKDDGSPMSVTEYMDRGGMSRIQGFDLYSISKLVAVDRIFYFEDIPGAMKEISKILGLEEELKLPEYKAKSSSRKKKAHYRELLNEEERRRIRIAFAREIELMGYEY